LINALQYFSSIAPILWGKLLTPLVTGIRVRGQFKPKWVPAAEPYRHVFIDTEGLLHAKTTTEIPSELTSRFKDVDTILLVESAKNALNSPIASRVFEAIASTGYTEKFVLLFTHMDLVKGENLASAQSKREFIFGGAKNILENQVARNLTKDAARQLARHLESNVFYFAYLDPNRYPSATETFGNFAAWVTTIHF
jgi:GTPase Era involved in 16S rRNA processing